MIVCFVMEGRLPHEARAHARIMIASVRRHMPSVRIVQHSDMAYPQTEGVDEVRRRRFNGDHIQRRWQHMADMMLYGREQILSLDCDVVVKRDVRDVFERHFDIAMCRTPDRRDCVYNAGVIFAKPSGASFWNDVLYEYAADPRIMDEWEGSQTALTRAADKSALKICNLNFDVYNFTPSAPMTIPATAALVHYRGRRKLFMARDNQEYCDGLIG